MPGKWHVIADVFILISEKVDFKTKHFQETKHLPRDREVHL